MAQIREGDRVRALTADGAWIEQRAASPVQRGDDFPIVLVCDETEWEAARAADRRPESLPWPAESVELLTNAARVGPDREPTQKTRPKKGKPVEIPIPTRHQFLRDLAKVAPPPPKELGGGGDRHGAKEEGDEHGAP